MQDERAITETHNALHRLRSHLTVALLATAQLCRKFASTSVAQRLCGYVTDALHKMAGEIARLDARMKKIEQRESENRRSDEDHRTPMQ